jgi:hypothetical protein
MLILLFLPSYARIHPPLSATMVRNRRHHNLLSTTMVLNTTTALMVKVALQYLHAKMVLYLNALTELHHTLTTLPNLSYVKTPLSLSATMVRNRRHHKFHSLVTTITLPSHLNPTTTTITIMLSSHLSRT